MTRSFCFTNKDIDGTVSFVWKSTIICSGQIEVVSIDANGRKMETDSADDIIFMEPGEYYMLVSVFPNSASATNYDYDLLVNRRLNSFDFAPAGNCVDAKATLNNDGSVTVYGTNTCPDTIEARAIVVYYSGGVIVDFQEGYLSNDYDLLLSPGEATEVKGPNFS